MRRGGDGGVAALLRRLAAPLPSATAGPLDLRRARRCRHAHTRMITLEDARRVVAAAEQQAAAIQQPMNVAVVDAQAGADAF